MTNDPKQPPRDLDRGVVPVPDRLPEVNPTQQLVFEGKPRPPVQPQQAAPRITPVPVHPRQAPQPQSNQRLAYAATLQQPSPIVYDPSRKGVGSGQEAQGGLMWLPPPEEEPVRAPAGPSAAAPVYAPQMPAQPQTQQTVQGQPPAQYPQPQQAPVVPRQPQRPSLVPDDLMGDAPIQAPEPPRKRSVIIPLMLVFGVLLALAMVAAAAFVVVKKVVLDKKPESSVVASSTVAGEKEPSGDAAPPTAPAQASAAETAAPPQPAPAEEPPGTEPPPAATQEEPPAAEAQAAPDEPDPEPAEKSSSAPSTSKKPRPKPKSTEPTHEVVKPPPVEEKVAPVKTAPVASTANLPDQPSKDQLKAALVAVQPKVNACGGGDTGLATTSITISGPTGKVTSAKVVSGGFKGTPKGACIEKAVKSAKFPKFKKPTFSFSYPFVVK